MVAALALLIAAVAIPRLTGSTPYVVETSSMQPLLQPGTLVIVRPAEAEAVEVGDVVTYQLRSGEPVTVTHRVVEVGRSLDGELRWRTQGDANTSADGGWVRPVQLRGVVWYSIPYAGYLSAIFDSGSRRTIEICLGIALILYGVGYLLRSRRQQQVAA